MIHQCRIPTGSSPLTRGAPQPNIPVRGCSGLIPAHAGSTGNVHRRVLAVGAHPRSRGEHPVVRTSPAFVAGSSPLTRGARDVYKASMSPSGLIPAHAGSTLSRAIHRDLWRAHPRSRGEHWSAWPCSLMIRGSSPLTRGARCRRCWRWSRWRLIPAHAGSTHCQPRNTGWAWAHPRSRGEHSSRLIKN